MDGESSNAFAALLLSKCEFNKNSLAVVASDDAVRQEPREDGNDEQEEGQREQRVQAVAPVDDRLCPGEAGRRGIPRALRDGVQCVFRDEDADRNQEANNVVAQEAQESATLGQDALKTAAVGAPDHHARRAPQARPTGVFPRPGQQRKGDPDQGHAPEVVRSEAAHQLPGARAAGGEAVAQVLRQREVAGEHLHSSDQRHEHAGREELRALEVQDEAHQLVLVRGPRERHHGEEAAEEDEADPEDGQARDGDHRQVDRVARLPEERLVRGEVVVQEPRLQPPQQRARCRRRLRRWGGSSHRRRGGVPTPAAATGAVPHPVHRGLHAQLHLRLDVLPEPAHGGPHRRPQPAPEVGVPQRAVPEKGPHVVQQVLQERGGDLHELLHSPQLLLGPPGLQERP
eukprot:CAMPEP_0175267848 /NCGR_PEP_ID=MMETSP0093-20121207/44052_1 /TAXON_ID=311494 /ORGANISM="Alexandrium monilatum, Strain CCMP3105" /LENGTH=399 /DNA_ID=CAMNT_0016562481 /DNA_START=16 /DNA_END=1211 /DNA_ORIENTATION=-